METTTDQSAGVIVKSDQTGRTRYTPEYKREVLAAYCGRRRERRMIWAV